MNIVDYIILGIIGLNIIYGLYRGFIQSLLSLGGSILAVASHRTAAPTASEAVTGSRVVTSSLTGVDRRKE